MSDPIVTGDAHREAEELLPWYVTGQLDPGDRKRVEDHLAACTGCRRMLATEHRLIDEFRAWTPEVDSGWQRLRARIEPRLAIRPRVVQSTREFRRLLNRPAVAMLAAAQLAFVVFAGGVLLSLNQPAYHALGSAEVPIAANMLVIFQPDSTDKDIRDLLKASGASLVSGPTAADAYLVHVAPDQRATALAKFQADDHVRVAQPIDGPSR